MARIKNSASATARSATDIASNLVAAPVARPAGDSPTAAVLAALSAEPGGATVAVIAEHAGIRAAAARQALLAQEKAGAATHVKAAAPASLTGGSPEPNRPARRSPRHRQRPRRAACPGPGQ